jgi:biotin carboxyl carrier protein
MVAKQIKKTSRKENKAKRKAAPEVPYEKLHIQGTDYKTLFTKKFVNRKSWKAHDPKIIVSYLPGTILEIFIKEGQKLEEGAPVLILEAMKMRNKVNMPMDGTIKSINVSVGDRIPKGQVIFELE